MDLATVQSLVRSLELPKEHYVLFGSLPMLAHGLLDRVNDIDILADATAWQFATTLGTLSISAKGHDVIELGDIEIYKEWMGLDVVGVINRAIIKQGLPYATLEDVLYYKLLLNRPKDQEHIRLLREYLHIS